MRFFRFSRTKPLPKIEEGPDHILTSRGLIALNEAGSELADRFAQVERPYLHLRQAWVGAILARLFQRYKWLQSLTITLTCKIETDYSGGQYENVGCTVTHVKAVPGADLPEPLQFAGGFDDLSAMALLDAGLAFDSHDLYVSIVNTRGQSRVCTLTVNRTAIETMLNGDRLSGMAAYNAWFLQPTVPMPTAVIPLRRSN